MGESRSARKPQRLGSTILFVCVLAASGCDSGTDAGETAGGEELASETSPPDERTGTESETPPSGSGSDRQSGGTGGSGDRQGGGGAPIGAAPGKVVGSPIRIPALEQNGNPPNVIAAAVEPEVKEQCDGSLCVTLLYVAEDGRSLSLDADDPVASQCGWAPSLGGVPLRTELEVDRESEVRFVFQCDDRGDTSGGESEAEDGSSRDSDSGEEGSGGIEDTITPTSEDNGQLPSNRDS